MRFCPAPLDLPDPSKVSGGAQFIQAHPLMSGNIHGSVQMAFDFRYRSSLDPEHFGVKPINFGAHEVFAVRLGMPVRGLDMTERRVGPAGEQAALGETTIS